MTDVSARTPLRRAGLVLAIVAAVLLVAFVALWASRKIIAREALTGWLEARGIASEVEVEAFGLTGFTGRLQVGDPKNPDFTAERAVVEYRLRGFSPEVRSIRLEKPVLRASFRDGKLSLGALDPIVEEYRRRPPRPEAAKPRIEVSNGLLLLATDYGPTRIAANARIENGRLLSLAAASAPAHLRGEGFDLALGASNLRVTSRLDRLEATLDAPVEDGRVGGLAVDNGRLQVALRGPYPDLQKRRGEGALTIRAHLDGQTLTLADQTLDDASLSAAFTGQTAGWIDNLVVSGEATADLRAAAAELGPARAAGLRATATAANLHWSRRSGDTASTRLRISGAADRLVAQDLTLTRVNARLRGPLAIERGGASLSLSGSAAGRGAWSGLGAPEAGDSAEIAALKRGARSFTFQAPGVAMSLDRGPARLALLRPVSLRPEAGGRVQLAPWDEGYRLTLAGGGLPEVDAHITRFALQSNGATAAGRARASLSIGPIEQGVFDAAGSVHIGDGLRFTASRCTTVTAARLELGENDVERLSGRLCPDGRPMLTLGNGWSLAGRAADVSAGVPFLQANVADAQGPVSLAQTRGRLRASARITDARVTDAAPKPRFNPLRMSGEATLANEQWTADLAFRTPGGVQVATADLRHDGRSGQGGVAIATGELNFTEGGLQPAQLSPLAEALGSPAEGRARFEGGFRWTGAGATSSGTLTIPELDFASPAGRVEGLSGEIAFTSLAPLVAAPGQVLRAEAIDAFAPLTKVTATFGLEDNALTISGGEAQVGGGRVVVEALEVPLDPDRPTRGVLAFEGVQLHDLVEASPFGDHVDLDAKVSGRVPFEAQGQTVRVTGGELHAIQPGRLSIERAALTSVAAEGEVTSKGAAPPVEATADTFTDFAYQAMENLAFDKLDASISTRDDGRLGVLFHIVGRHDPPQHQEIRLSIFDLIGKKFLNRKLPLPSGTGVDLTLDTTLNLNELLGDYAEYRRLRGSGAVQP